MRGGIRRWRDEWRPSAVTLGAPVYPLVVLFGLNAVDELDRAAFAVLLPDIRDRFDLSNAGALQLVSLTTIAVLLIKIPLSFYCDRGNRVRIATIGAAVWAAFSFGTGAAITVTSVGMLILMRIGAGFAEARDGGLRWVAKRRHILVPSLVADRRPEDFHVTTEMAEAVAEVAERPEVDDLAETRG